MREMTKPLAEIDPPGDPRLSELQAHARALGLVLRVEVVPGGSEEVPDDAGD